MGKGQSKLSRDRVDELAKSTKLDPVKIKEWYKAFMTNYPTGEMTPDELHSLYKLYFPYGDCRDFSDRLYKLFTSETCPKMTFDVFLKALSVTTCTEMDDKLDWTFRFYDLDGNNEVTYDEMVSAVGIVYRMVHPVVKLPEDETTAADRVNKLYKSWNLQSTDVLSKEDFIAKSRGTSDIFLAFQRSTHIV